METSASQRGKENTLSPYHQCPRFNICSANVCPLDPDKRQRNFIPGESVCTLAKSIRLKLGESLPWKGLTSRELAGRKTWENLLENQKVAPMVRLGGLALKHRGNSTKSAL